jgi:hypothetical protein
MAVFWVVAPCSMVEVYTALQPRRQPSSLFRWASSSKGLLHMSLVTTGPACQHTVSSSAMSPHRPALPRHVTSDRLIILSPTLHAIGYLQEYPPLLFLELTRVRLPLPCHRGAQVTHSSGHTTHICDVIPSSFNVDIFHLFHWRGSVILTKTPVLLKQSTVNSDMHFVRQCLPNIFYESADKYPWPDRDSNSHSMA